MLGNFNLKLKFGFSTLELNYHDFFMIFTPLDMCRTVFCVFLANGGEIEPLSAPAERSERTPLKDLEKFGGGCAIFAHFLQYRHDTYPSGLVTSR